MNDIHGYSRYSRIQCTGRLVSHVAYTIYIYHKPSSAEAEAEVELLAPTITPTNSIFSIYFWFVCVRVSLLNETTAIKCPSSILETALCSNQMLANIFSSISEQKKECARFLQKPKTLHEFRCNCYCCCRHHSCTV